MKWQRAETRRRLGLATAIGMCLCCVVAADAQTGTGETTPRVIILMPSRSAPTTPQIQWHVEKERAARSKARRKSRRRLPTSISAPASASNTAGLGGGQERTATMSAGSTQPVKNGTGQSGQSPPTTPPPGGKIDVVPPDQRIALAQALFADALIERLPDRLGIGVVSENEVGAALKTLHLTPEQAMQPENARKLCAQFHCAAALMPRLTACDIREGATRDASVFAQVRIVSVAGKTAPVRNEVQKIKGVAQDAVPVPANWPTQLEVAGSAIGDRVLFHKQYQKPQGDLIRDATQQAVTLLLHALRTGEQAPLMRPEDRVAVTPVLVPMGADKLVFTPAGRRVQPVALDTPPSSLTPLFLPDLLPVLPERVIGEDEVRAALAAQGVAEAQLWAAEDQPMPARVQALGRRLHADYVLQARVTDVELSESGPGAGSSVNTSAAEQARAARVEATAALTRVADGALLWRDRVTATMTASPAGARFARAQTNESLVRDATHFALVELQRRLRKYRSTFER